MAYESRPFQTADPATPPAATAPLVDETASGDVQAIKLLNPTAGSTEPMVGQKARTDSLPVALSTEDAALLADLLTNDTFDTGIGAAITGQSLESGGSGILGWLASIRKAITDMAAKLPALVSGRMPVDGSGVTQPVSAASLPLPSGAATAANQGTANTSLASIDGKLPALVSSRVPVDGSGVTQPVSAASLPLPSGAATSAAQTAQATLTGAVDETAPASDTASSGLNGRLQRIAQRLASLIALLPASLGQKAKAASLAVTLASDQDALPITDNGGALTVDNGGTFAVQAAQSGTWAVSLQPTTSGGSSIYRSISLLATGQSVKGSAGQLYGYYLYNGAGSTRYVKLYNSSGAPTVGSDTPVLTIPLPAGAAANAAFPNGVVFSSGIGIAATTGVADSDTAAPSANEVIVNVFYK